MNKIKKEKIMNKNLGKKNLNENLRKKYMNKKKYVRSLLCSSFFISVIEDVVVLVVLVLVVEATRSCELPVVPEKK